VKEVPWLLTKKERGRKKENVQKNEPASVNFQGGRKRSHRSGSIENPQSSVIYKGVLTRSLEIASALFRSPSATRQSPILRRLTALQSSLRNEFAFIVCNRNYEISLQCLGLGTAQRNHFNSFELRLSI